VPRRRSYAPSGAQLEEIALPNDLFVPVLCALLIDQAPTEGIIGPVDFSALGVREFGTIYEGLLENELAIVETDLTTKRVKDRDIYWPVEEQTRKGVEVVVRQGEAYLHDASGARKATGSYYTKPFAVAHLLDHALEPALDAHIERLAAVDDTDAAAAFFDFRVADIAMGSGHFLVAATDRIERKLSQYLAERPGGLPGVRLELARLREAAKKALGPAGEAVEIEDTQLLRRQMARRCIYGVDINPLAVQLARVSLWIHTFVPGLPLSFLDHNLRQGNSLVGIATIDEAREELAELRGALFAQRAVAVLDLPRASVERLGKLADADAAEIKLARETWAEASRAVRPAEALLDIVTASGLDDDVRGEVSQEDWIAEPDAVPDSSADVKAAHVLRHTHRLHFPIGFPEVFLRERPGFDCILGNPPWQEATVEEHAFWGRYSTGLRRWSGARSAQEREKEIARLREARPDLVALLEREVAATQLQRQVLLSGPFPGMGSGDPDLYKAFCWRFWQLLCDGGRMGVMLPRSTFATKGSEDFRRAALSNGCVCDLTFLVNRGGWVFDEAEHRYTVARSSIGRGAPGKPRVSLRGPYASLDRFRTGSSRPAPSFPVEEVLDWTESAALPMLPGDESVDVFAQLRTAPNLGLNRKGLWRARPHTELHATNDKSWVDLDTVECPCGYWPVYKGESSGLWEPDTGIYYGWADPAKLVPHLQQKRLSSGRSKRSPFNESPVMVLQESATLPCRSARIALRDLTKWDNQRTMIAALAPPRVFVANTSPYLLWPRGDRMDEAYVLGVLCSIPLDWYARRFVELHLNFHVLNAFPIPRPSRDDPLWQRTVALAGRLAAPDERFAEGAGKVGVEWGPLPEDERGDMIAELDAVVAHLYGLTEPQLIHIFETFHEGWDYALRLKAVLRHYRGWAGRV